MMPFVSDVLAAVQIGKKWRFLTLGYTLSSRQFTAAYYFRVGVGIAQVDSGDVLMTIREVLASGYDS